MRAIVLYWYTSTNTGAEGAGMVGRMPQLEAIPRVPEALLVHEYKY
jgi:hypothetical protein